MKITNTSNTMAMIIMFFLLMFQFFLGKSAWQCIQVFKFSGVARLQIGQIIFPGAGILPPCIITIKE